jgi:pimeloyl-ACP methyl ester carboxylesterase
MKPSTIASRDASRHTGRMVALGVVLWIVLGAVTFLGRHSTARSAAVAGPSDLSGLFDIGGGRRMYLECRGQGSPTVVLEAGYRSPASVWSDDLVQPDMPRTMVFQGVASFTRVCMYERPGAGSVIDDVLHSSRSDPVPQPRTAESVVADLHALLHAAGVHGPYVLAGHSLGGMFVRLYAATYPSEVAGLVLVDAWYEGLEQLLTPAQWEAYIRLNSEVPPELAGYRDYETLDFAAASAVMRGAATARPLAPMPLAVLSKGQSFGIPAEALGFDPDALDRAWVRAQEQLATLAPGARHVVATESAHYVQLQQPELVIDAIRQAVTAVRDPASWPRAATGEGAGRISWRPCPTVDLPTRECGELAVPLSYREPQGATISLAVARVPATDPDRRIGSLFLNPGGPGQPGFEELGIMYAPLPEAIRARFDIVGFDPRGIGESAPVRCFAGPEEQEAFFATVPRVPVGTAETAALLRANEDLAQRCGERNAVLLPHLSSANVAQDLDRLRQAVGDERLNYWGVSYGTYLGATYANLFPDHIRAMVLDGVINPPWYTSFDQGDGGVVGPDTTSFLRSGSNQGSADTFGAFIDECARAGVGRCAFAAPSAAATRAKFDTLMERLRTNPAIPVRPDGLETISYSDVLEVVWNVLYTDPLWPVLAQALQQLDAGDAAGFLVTLGALDAPPSPVYRNSREAQAASNCLDTDNPADPALYPAMARAAEERTPYFGAIWSYLSMPCAFWPAQDADRYRGPWDAQTSAPILLLSRVYDPATPHGGAVAASRTLANARLLTIDGWGHGYYLAGKSTCADEAATAYFIGGQLPAAGAVCPEDAPPFGN